MIYIREAHPTDGRQAPQNVRDGVLVADPKSDVERLKVAKDFATQFSIKMPIYVDTIDDKASKAFSSWPDRIYVVGKDGTLSYIGGPGPAGFKPEEVEPVLKKALG